MQRVNQNRLIEEELGDRAGNKTSSTYGKERFEDKLK